MLQKTKSNMLLESKHYKKSEVKQTISTSPFVSLSTSAIFFLLTYPLPALKSWFLIFAMSFTWCCGDSISFHVWLSHCGSHCYYSWQYFSDSCCLWLFGVCSATSSEECGLVIQRSNFHTISVTFALFQKDKGLSNRTYFSATWFKSLSKMNVIKWAEIDHPCLLQSGTVIYCLVLTADQKGLSWVPLTFK